MKQRTRLPLVFLSGCLFLAACNSAPQAAQSPDNRAASEAAIRKADADWVKAAQTKDVESWMAFYADDAVALPPNEKTAANREAIRKSISNLLGLPGLAINWSPTKVEVARSSDIGYLHGTYEVSFNGPNGQPTTELGKMVEIWRKQPDGSWKCIVDMWSSDMPAPPAK